MQAPQTHQVIQGTPEWLTLRAQPNTYTASEAPTMMGASKYMTRNELLKQKATGLVPEIDPGKQRLFDRGHAAEALARPIAESIFGEELYPVTMTRMVDGLNLLASLDGLDMAGERVWENKLLNAELVAAIRAGDLDPHYYWQLEQELLVSGAETVYLTASDGTKENTHGCWYTSYPERRAQLIAGWKQFQRDLLDYQHVEVLPPAVATPTQDLPALMVRVDGKISLVSNLDLFGQMLRKFIDGLDRNPSTDQAFADCDSAVKKLEKAEDALRAAESNALAQTASIDDMRKAIALQIELARTTRLALEKIVKARKDTIRIEIIDEAKQKFQAEIAALNKLIGFNYMPGIPVDFAGVIKNKRTVESVRNAVDTELARVKIEANATAQRIQRNLREPALAEFGFLFADIPVLCLKSEDDFQAAVTLRVADHRAKEAARLEAEREKIRAEEQAKAERDAREKLAVEQAERDRAATVEAARIQREQLEQAQAGRIRQELASERPVVSDEPAQDVCISRSLKSVIRPAAPAAATPAGRAPSFRPTDADIIAALAMTYRVHESKIVQWLLEMDLEKASQDLAAEFAI